MEEHKLLKSQKNEVFDILQTEGLEPADFSWTRAEAVLKRDLLVPRLNHRDKRFYYQFDYGGNPDSPLGLEEKHFCEFSPGDSMSISRQYPGSWNSQLGYVLQWVNNLKKEIEAPDLWAEIEKYKPTLVLVPAERIVNEPIPAYEVEEISEKLSQLADMIEEQFKLNEDQNRFVRGKLEYLADAAKRQPRRDWENIFISVFITIAFQLALEPEKAQQFWQVVKSIVGPFIHLIGS